MKGFDLSYAQADINWDVVSHQNLDFVYVKVAEGRHTIDAMHISHSRNAASCNMHLGYYYFAHPGRCDAKESAQFFKANLEGLPSPGLIHALDIEVNEENISPEAMLQWIHDFIEEWNAPIIIYGGPGFLNANLPASHDLGQYPLWLAEYEGRPAPTVYPKGWTQCAIWQNSGNGTIPGIKQKVDINTGYLLPLIAPVET